MSPLIFSGVLGLVLASSILFLTLQLFHRYRLGERAKELHHTHHVAVSRLGGIGLAGAFAAIGAFFLGGDFPHAEKITCRTIMIPALAMFALGLWDDLKPVGARRKLALQIAIATLAYLLGIKIVMVSVPFGSGSLDFGFWVSWPLTMLWLVAITNLINLIDGVDGLAGGICLMLMVLLTSVGDGGSVSYLAAGMIGALLSFLYFNFPPARIYMGDGGAYFMGFLIACQTIVSSQKGTVFAALLAPLFVLALPILDTSLAILRRGMHGLPLFRPDRLHLHHRLLNEGISRRKVVLGAYAFTAFFLFLGLIVFWSHGHHLAVLIGIGVLFILLTASRLSFSREWFSVGRVLGNSLTIRAEIQYTLAQTRWLILEGRRCPTLDSLCEDTAFIARKLGFNHLNIKLVDVEKTWSAADIGNTPCWTCRQYLPGHKECHIELAAPIPPDGEISKTAEFLNPTLKDENTFRIVSELLIEGWAKAVTDWHHLHSDPPRFTNKSAGTRVMPDSQAGS